MNITKVLNHSNDSNVDGRSERIATNNLVTNTSSCVSLISSPANSELYACQFSTWYPIFSQLDQNEERDEEEHRYRHSKVRRIRQAGTSKRNNVTIPSIIIKELPANFLNYLLSDGITLPIGAAKLSSFATVKKAKKKEKSSDYYVDSDDDSTAGIVWSDDDSDNVECQQQQGRQQRRLQESELSSSSEYFHFPKLNHQIQSSIQLLGGRGKKNSKACGMVFGCGIIPKLNWSTPKDAIWINNNSLRCKTAGDVYLLLKSSDFCYHDIQSIITQQHQKQKPEEERQQKQQESLSESRVALGEHSAEAMTLESHSSSTTFNCLNLKLELALRQYISNINPSMEFRCFVKCNRLLAISQRHHTQYFQYLKSEKLQLKALIFDFFTDYIQNNFSKVFERLDNNWLMDRGDGASLRAVIQNYVMDIFIVEEEIEGEGETESLSLPALSSERKFRVVYLLDFNIWGPTTDSLLFEWEELDAFDIGDHCDFHDLNNSGVGSGSAGEDDHDLLEFHHDMYDGVELPFFRIVETENQVHQDPLASYRAPIDTVELATKLGGFGLNPDSFMDALRKQCAKPSELSSASDSD